MSLEWFVIIAPTVFALVIEIMGENVRRHWLWKLGVFAFGVVLSLLTWLQLSRQEAAALKVQGDLKSSLEKIEGDYHSIQGRLTAFKKDIEADLVGLHQGAPIKLAAAGENARSEAAPQAPRSPAGNQINGRITMGLGVSEYATATVTLSPEHIRRNEIASALRKKYILSHDDVSAGIISGTEWPPLDWMNTELSSMGETWKASPGSVPSQLDVMDSDPKKP